MSKKNLTYKGTDISSFYPASGYSVAYQKRIGNNSFVSINGVETEDVVAVKAIVTVPIMPLTSARAAQLNALLFSGDTHGNLVYFDPAANDYRTIDAIPSEASGKYAGVGADGKDYWVFDAIEFRER